MPNVKIFVDEDLLAVQKTGLSQVLTRLRDIVSKHLEVHHSACQFALLPVVALSDQPAVNVEIHIMPHPSRTKEVLEAMGVEVQKELRDVTGKPVAFRCTQLDPMTYVALK